MRDLAISAMEGFAALNGFDLVMREEDRGDTVCFIGTAPDGREFSVGYEKAADRA